MNVSDYEASLEEEETVFTSSLTSNLRDFIVFSQSSSSGDLAAYDLSYRYFNFNSDSESDSDCYSDFDADSEDLKSDSLALQVRGKTSLADGSDYEQPEILDSEKCLLSLTKPRHHYTLPLLSRSEGRKKYFSYDDVSDGEWRELTDMIIARDAEGIGFWFKGRKISRKAQILVEKRVNSPLCVAARVGSLAILEFLLGQSFCMDKNFRPMFEAVNKGHIHIVKKLLEIGVDVNMPVEEYSKITPLHVAAQRPMDTSNMINFLVANGAEMEKTDVNSHTPLHKAVMYGSAESVMALLKAGATVDQELLDCNRPLIHMAVHRDVRMVNLIYTVYPHVRIFPEFDEILAAIGCGKVNTLRYFVQKNIPLSPEKSWHKPIYDQVLQAASKITDPSVCELIIDIILGSGYKPLLGVGMIFSVTDLFGDVDQVNSRKKIEDYYTYPKSLQQLACFKIRAIMGPALLQSVHLLPVPSILQNYIQLKHL